MINVNKLIFANWNGQKPCWHFFIFGSKLDDSFPEGQFLNDGYHALFRLDRNGGGGCLLYVPDDIKCLCWNYFL